MWRSNSSISSRTGCPPDIVNEEDHNVDNSEIPNFSKKKAKYEMGNFCEQYGLPPIAPSRQKGKKNDKSHKSYSHKKYDKQMSSKLNVLTVKNLIISVRIAIKKLGKLKNKFNMLKIGDKEQEELFRILESNNSFDSLEDDFSSSSDSCYQSADNSSDSPNIKIGCRDSCCNVINSVKTLTKSEEYEKHKSTISFEETLGRFNKKKSKDLTVNDLQHEINIVKQEISELKHKNKKHIKPKLLVLKVDKSDCKHDEHKDGDESSQQALFSDKGIADVFIDSQLALVNKIFPPK